ncbi:MAG: hypothetical protein IT198_01980 [Acidimicrobiia bacterium]|nr:hypothetical protein [Acidimicrobiia bacterium]
MNSLAGTGILAQILDGKLPHHGGEAGSTILLFWGFFFVTLGAVLLIGSVALILTTDVGFKRAIQVIIATIAGYLAFHSLAWMLNATQAPRFDPAATGFWGLRVAGITIGLVSLIVFLVMVVFMHVFERQRQRVPDSPDT